MRDQKKKCQGAEVDFGEIRQETYAAYRRQKRASQEDAGLDSLFASF
jgi:hypothetical protein